MTNQLLHRGSGISEERLIGDTYPPPLVSCSPSKMTLRVNRQVAHYTRDHLRWTFPWRGRDALKSIRYRIFV